MLASLAAAIGSASAQSAPKRSDDEIQASYQAHRAEFDYLLGDWEFTADSKQWGKFRGVWSATRMPEGQILDEYRVLGDNNQTIYVTTTIRSYNAVLDRWELIGMDAKHGLQDVGTGKKVGDEMHIEQKFGVMTQQPSTMRIRYYNIQPDRFSWTADRSTDGGKTWVEKHQTIEARRIGPKRSLEPLSKPRPASATPSAARQTP